MEAYEKMKRSYEEAKARGETTEGDAAMYAMLEEFHNRLVVVEEQLRVAGQELIRRTP